MTTFAKIINYLFIVSFILKSLFHYLHVRETNKDNLKNVFKYLYLIPVRDKFNSKFKILANISTAIAIIMVIIFLYINKENIVAILENWNNIP
jgi:hypothetical protein